MSWQQTPNERQFRSDGYVNMLTRYGTSQDSSTAYEFQGAGLIPDMSLTEQYESNGLFSKIIDTPSEEMVKHGFTLGLKSPDIETYIADELQRLDWEEKASAAIKWARLYGGALGVMLINDGRGIDEPLDWKRVSGIDELRVYERAVVSPDYSSLYGYDPRDPERSTTSKFGMPEYYQVNSIYGQFWVHESRCLIFRNGVLPESTMQPYYRFWGLPEYLKIRRELREAVTAHSTGVKMLERSVQAIYKMVNLASVLATDEGMDTVIRRLQAIDMARGILNTVAIDSDGEDYDFRTIPMAGVKDVIDTTCNMLSAVTNIPQTILFGRAPAGMNSTGQSDLENYYNYIERLQKLMLKGNLQTLIDVIAHVGVKDGKLEETPEIKLTFNPLWSASDTEQVAIDLQKAQTQQTKAQTAQMYIEMGALDPSEVRRGLAQDEEFQVEELLDGLEEEDLWGGEDIYGEAMPTEKSAHQTENLLSVLQKYNTGEMDRDSALALLTSAFPFDRATAGQILGEPTGIVENPQLTPDSGGRGDDDEPEWITVNGTPVPIDDDGGLGGDVGAKIESESTGGETGESPANSGENTAQNSQNPLTSEGAEAIMKDPESHTSGESEGEETASKETGDKQPLSATGANPSLPTFTPENLDRHWGGDRDHSSEYPGLTKAQYEERALELLRSATNEDVSGYKAADGAVVRYDKANNDFVKGYDTGVATMFKPDDGEAYYQRDKKKRE